jgi:hypothetical protein
VTLGQAPPEGRRAAGLRLGLGVAALVGGEVVLWRAGSALPSFPLDVAGLRRTLDEAEPLGVAVGVLRLLALGVGGGLLLATVLGLLARACGAAWLVVHLDRWTPAGVRRLLDRALGLGLAASIGLSAVPAAADGGSPPPSPTLRRLPDAPTTTLRRLPDGPAPPVAAGPTTALRRLPDAAPSPPAPAPPAMAAAAEPKVPSDHEVVVRPGDSFWVLAERHETERLGRRPTEAEVGACWQELVAVNRHRLAVPDDPDLLFPGQTLIVPCP